MSNSRAGVGEHGIVRCCLIETIIQRIKQRVMQPGAHRHAGVAVAKDIPGQADTRLRQEARSVIRQRVLLDRRVCVDDTISKVVDPGASLRFAPAGGRLAA
jgi:molybdopterin-guanine dinucleotide biosynthesis protein